MKSTALLLAILAFSFALPAHGAELHSDIQEILQGRVSEIVSERAEDLPGLNTRVTVQELKVEITKGPAKGKVVEITNDYMPLQEGDKVFVNRIQTIEGQEMYGIRDVDRRGAIYFAVLVFALAVILLGGWQGIRSLLSLGASLLIILFVLLPLLVQGYSPMLLSIVISSIILTCAIFFTHGFNRQSAVALLGTVVAICITSVLAYLAVYMTRLTGFASDESVYLDIATEGILNFRGLLLGGMIIGVLGVLDDIAITQTMIVSELYESARHSSQEARPREIYRKALRVGKEHVGALVNTLALAYTGTALPLLLFFTNAQSPFSYIINSELFATEIIRTVVGSIGLVLTVPITTYFAVRFLKNAKTAGKVHAHGHSHS